MRRVRIECPNCGMVMEVAGAAPAVLCVACGGQIDLSGVQGLGGLPESLEAVSRTAPQVNIQRPVPRKRDRGPVLAVAISLLVLLGVAVGVMVVGTRKSEPSVARTDASAPADEAYVRLAPMKSKAEGLALKNDLVGAHAEYGKLLSDPAGSASSDPRVRDLVGAARADQSRIYQMLVNAQPPTTNAEEKPPAAAEEQSRPPAPARVDPPTTIAASTPPEVNPYSEQKRITETPAQSRPEASGESRPAFPQPRPGPAPMAPVVPPIAPAVASGSDDMDGRIGKSMQKACDLILSGFKDGELLPQFGKGDVRSAGLHALCVYALLQAGQALDDDRLSIKGKILPQMIEVMKSHDLDGPNAVGQIGAPRTYAHSLRAAALAVYDRPQDRKALQADVKWLVNAQSEGAYTYDDRNRSSITALLNIMPDNSNSQYGLLGVWAGAEAGVEVSDKYWQAVDNHWKTTQQPDGQWRYSQDPSGWASLAMTCGGLASLMVTYDYLDVPKLHGAVGRDPYPGQIGMGLRRLEAGDNALSTPNDHTFYLGYDLYSLERVGLASGLKFFGTHDWYRELADKAMKLQWPSGAYGRDTVDEHTLIGTSYVVLFLARGRHPVMMEKLRFEKYWDNRPRDLANLTKYASHELERPLNWQVVSVDRPWQDWFDSPVLFIASHQAPLLTEENYANLRSFVEAGGLILTQTDGASDAFNKWVPQLVKKVCPQYELEQLPPTHLLYTTNYKITAPPKLVGASNGSRLLVVHSPVDLSAAWQRHERVTQRAWFQLGINIFAYAGGKRDMRNRVATLIVPEPTREAASKVAVARVTYPGNWDPEPYAWKRLSKKMQNDSGVALELKPVAVDAMAAESAPLAHLTGTAKWTFTDGQCAALASYVKGGGVLLIDSTGGQEAFAQSVERDLLPKAFPGVNLAAMDANHPVLKEVATALRPYAQNVMSKPPALRMAKVGEGYVIFTPIDLNSGLLGTNTWGIVGYTPSTCEQMARNLLAWAATVRQGR